MSSSDICTFYLRGACRFGHRCWNSHDWMSFEEALNPAGSMEAPNGEEYKPSTSTIINDKSEQKHLLDTTKDRETDQTDGFENSIENSSDTASPKSIEKNASKSKEIENKAQLMCQNSRKKKVECDEIIKTAIHTDLQCNICFELFIKPTVLNCSHTFCETCIYIWTKRVKKCPICRMHIKSKSYCLTLDNFIENIIEYMPKEIKYKRAATIKDRSQTKIDNDADQKPRQNRTNGTQNERLSLESRQILDLLMGRRAADIEDDDVDDNDIDDDVIMDQSEVMRMNLQDTVRNSGGLNPLSRYLIPGSENTLQQWLSNSLVRR